MQYREPENQRKNILLLFGLGTLGLNTLVLLLLFFNQTFLQQLSLALTPQSLIELTDGRAITADPQANLEREPATISRFVGESLTLMLTSSPRLRSIQALATTSPLLSVNLKEKFTERILKQQRALRLRLGDRNIETVLVIERISQPIKIEAGQWKVQVLAHQLLFSQSDLLGKSLPFNQLIGVRATNKNQISLSDKPRSLDLATYRQGEARLEIFDICAIEEKNCSLNLQNNQP